MDNEEKMSIERLEKKIKDVKDQLHKYNNLMNKTKTKSTSVTVMQQVSEKRRLYKDKIDQCRKELAQLNLMFPEGYTKNVGN